MMRSAFTCNSSRTICRRTDCLSFYHTWTFSSATSYHWHYQRTFSTTLGISNPIPSHCWWPRKPANPNRSSATSIVMLHAPRTSVHVSICHVTVASCLVLWLLCLQIDDWLSGVWLLYDYYVCYQLRVRLLGLPRYVSQTLGSLSDPCVFILRCS